MKSIWERRAGVSLTASRSSDYLKYFIANNRNLFVLPIQDRSSTNINTFLWKGWREFK